MTQEPIKRIGEVYAAGRFGLSFEIFPPKTSEGDDALKRCLERLASFQPSFISCTYGAGGSTQSRTIDWCRHIQTDLGISAPSHLTCVGSTRAELLAWLALAQESGVGNIMALRGDPPQGQKEFQVVEGGLRYGNELVSLIRENFPNLGIGVAGYPETHQEAPDAATDLENLRRKVDAGADAVFTQLFYDNASFFDFRDRYQAAGLQVPLVPGIMPITEFARMQRITSMCGAAFPTRLAARLEAVQDDKAAQTEIGVEHAIEQCRELMDQGAPGLHFYVLNRWKPCRRVLEALGMSPRRAGCASAAGS